MTPDEIRHAVTQTLTRFETDWRDPDKVLEYVHDEVDWWVPGDIAVSGHRDRAALRRMVEGLPNYSDTGMMFRPTGFLIEGDRAAVEAESCVQFRDGREYRNHYHLLFEFRDGKIWRCKQYFDTHHAARIMGA